jgi:hypothetical protein
MTISPRRNVGIVVEALFVIKHRVSVQRPVPASERGRTARSLGGDFYLYSQR